MAARTARAAAPLARMTSPSERDTVGRAPMAAPTRRRSIRTRPETASVIARSAHVCPGQPSGAHACAVEFRDVAESYELLRYCGTIRFMSPNLTVRAWSPQDGDPGCPQQVLGIPVDRLLARRPDAPGALVALNDGASHLRARSQPSVVTGCCALTCAGESVRRPIAPTGLGSPRCRMRSSACCPSRERAERRRQRPRRGAGSSASSLRRACESERADVRIWRATVSSWDTRGSLIR